MRAKRLQPECACPPSIENKHLDACPFQLTETQRLIADECRSLEELLIRKNRKYGDSAISPTRVFSKASAVEQILVRIDDKLSRLRSSQADEDEDVVLDLLGYLILLRVARKKELETPKT